jgi:putative membrane protein
MATLRQKLALDRTVYANERTWLAYVRTALTFFIAGASIIQFFSAPVMFWAGVTLIVLAPPVFIYGTVTYLLRARRYSKRLLEKFRAENK